MTTPRHVQIRLSPEMADWFDQTFPFATKQQFFEQCLVHLRAAIECGALPVPNVYPASAAIRSAKAITETRG